MSALRFQRLKAVFFYLELQTKKWQKNGLIKSEKFIKGLPKRTNVHFILDIGITADLYQAVSWVGIKLQTH